MLVDLTRPLDPADYDRIPAAARAAAQLLVPRVESIGNAKEGADFMCSLFGCERSDLPDGEGWADENLHLKSHMGTHVDAPLHYGTTCEGRPARTITDIDIEELYVDAIVLDLRGLCEGGKSISVGALEKSLERSNAEIPAGGAVLLRTGQEAYSLADLEYYNYPGMGREGTLWLADHGAKVLGTDALGWDRPFFVMRQAFIESGDANEIWDGHFAGREREVFIVQQMVNLDALPTSGFKVGFFPLPLTGCSAAPARVVAFLGGS